MAKSKPMTIVEALAKANGSKTEAARLLGIPRTTLLSRLENAGRSRVNRTPDAPQIQVKPEVLEVVQENALRARVKQLEKELAASQDSAKISAELYAAATHVKYAPLDSERRIRRAPRKRIGAKHLVLPDAQVKADVPINHLAAAGEYAVEKQPDTIAILADWWDMPSLSSYDRGKLQFEGRRYRIDIEAGLAAMESFLAPIRKAKGYKPRIVFTTGNHENRIQRVVEEDSRLEGTIGMGDLKLQEMGIEAYPFLQPVTIDGVKYAHYFPRAASGKITQTRNGAPNALAQLRREGGSCIAGHQQGFDIACLPLRDKLQWGIIAGSFYQHDEEYLSPQGTAYWRGVVMLHEVVDGYFNPMVVSLDYLLAKYA